MPPTTVMYEESDDNTEVASGSDPETTQALPSVVAVTTAISVPIAVASPAPTRLDNASGYGRGSTRLMADRNARLVHRTNEMR